MAGPIVVRIEIADADFAGEYEVDPDKPLVELVRKVAKEQGIALVTRSGRPLAWEAEGPDWRPGKEGRTDLTRTQPLNKIADRVRETDGDKKPLFKIDLMIPGAAEAINAAREDAKRQEIEERLAQREAERAAAEQARLDAMGTAETFIVPGTEEMGYEDDVVTEQMPAAPGPEGHRSTPGSIGPEETTENLPNHPHQALDVRTPGKPTGVEGRIRRANPDGGAGGTGRRSRPEGGAGGTGRRSRPEGGAGGTGRRSRPEGGGTMRGAGAGAGGTGRRKRADGAGTGRRKRPEGAGSGRASAGKGKGKGGALAGIPMPALIGGGAALGLIMLVGLVVILSGGEKEDVQPTPDPTPERVPDVIVDIPIETTPEPTPPPAVTPPPVKFTTFFSSSKVDRNNSGSVGAQVSSYAKSEVKVGYRASGSHTIRLKGRFDLYVGSDASTLEGSGSKTCKGAPDGKETKVSIHWAGDTVTARVGGSRCGPVNVKGTAGFPGWKFEPGAGTTLTKLWASAPDEE